MDYVLITGSSSGIGKGIAQYFSKKGMGVVLHGRNKDRLAEVEKSLNGPALSICADISTSDGISELITKIKASKVQLRSLVNNAGIFVRKSVLETSEDEITTLLATNFLAPFGLMKACHPLLKAHPKASVVNIASTLGQKSIALTALYSASKAALISLTETAALEWATDKIRVNSICPGIVDTPIHKGGVSEMASLHPLGRVGQLTDIASMTFFLVQDESSWITGSHFVVDGGIHLL